MILPLFPKRLDAYLSLQRNFRYVKGSVRISPFGADSSARAGIVTASQAANLLNLGYKVRFRYMNELADPENIPKVQDDPDSFEYAAKNHGSKHESAAVDQFFKHMPWKKIGCSTTQFTVFTDYLMVDDPPKSQFTIAATPDQLVYNPEDPTDIRLLEVKCPYRKWIDQTNISDDDEAWSLFADKHYIQCQIQMLCTGLCEAFLMFYVPNRDSSESDNFRIFGISADPRYQHFLLSSIYQAYRELGDKSIEKFKIIANEKAHNAVITSESKMKSSRLLLT